MENGQKTENDLNLKVKKLTDDLAAKLAEIKRKEEMMNEDMNIMKTEHQKVANDFEDL